MLKYHLLAPLNNKNGITITDAFKKILDESGCKQNKIWVDNSSKFYNKSLKSCLPINYVDIYSTHNKGQNLLLPKDLLDS